MPHRAKATPQTLKKIKRKKLSLSQIQTIKVPPRNAMKLAVDLANPK